MSTNDHLEQLIAQVNEQCNWKTGWDISSVQDDITITFTDGTRTVTVTPVGDDFSYWIKGVKYTHTTAQTKQIDDTEGIWYIYFEGYTLTASQTLWVIEDSDKCFVAMVYWDATNNKAIYLG